MAATNVQAFPGDVTISSNLAVDTNTLFVDSVGNKVGVRTSNPKMGGINVDGSFLAQGGDSTVFSHNLYYNDSWRYASANNGGAYMRVVDSEIQFWNAPNSGAEDAAATVSQRMTIDVDGKVGIGTTDPATTLEVAGNAKISSVYRETFGYSGSYNTYKYIGRFSTQANGHVEVTSAGNSQFNTNRFEFQRQFASTPHASGINSDHYLNHRWFWAADGNENYHVWHYIENAGASSGEMTYRIRSHAYSKPSDPSTAGRAEMLYGLWQKNAPGYNRVAIGSYYPNAGLTVYPTNASTGYTWRIYVSTNTGYGDNYEKWFIRDQGTITNMSIYSVGSIVTGGFLSSYSDARIKTDICDVEDNEALDILRLLKPKKYKYIDKIRGDDYVWGFIAQDVSNVLPYSTTPTTKYIPNIYNVGNVTDGNVVTFSSFNTSNLVSNVTSIKIINVDGSDKLVKITRVIDEHTIEVDQDVSVLTGALDEDGNVISGNQLFVYGQELDDVLTLNKSAIWTLSTAAIQEIDRQLQTEKEKIVNLEARITVLESA
jgi:hypothetical protein